MYKPSHISIDSGPVRFFDGENRFLITPEMLTLLKEGTDEMTFDMSHEMWLNQVWDCMDDVVRMLEWREITTKPLHISRCLVKVKDTNDADFLDARRLLYRGESTVKPIPVKSKEDQISQESLLFINKRDEYINDEKWCTSVADSFSRLLATLAIKKIAMNVIALLELLTVANTAIIHPDDRKMYLELVGFELYARASIAVLRGEEVR